MSTLTDFSDSRQCAAEGTVTYAADLIYREADE